MNIPFGVIFGIIAMLSWGTADFFVAKAVKKTDVFRVFLWSQVIGLILFFLIFLLFFNFPINFFDIAIIVLIAGLIQVIAYLAFYKGLQIGKLSIISPLAASWSVVTVILSLVLLNEKLAITQFIGVGLAIIGSVLVSFKFHDLIKLKIKNISKGVGYAVIALFGWGIGMFLIGVMISKLGWFFPMFFVKAVIVFYSFSYSGLSKREIKFPKNVFSLVLLIGIFELLAFMSYGLGINKDYNSIVAPISAAFPMVTIILARIFFKEKLEINQKIGVLSVILGLVLLSL